MREVIRYVDINGDGLLNKEEFENLLKEVELVTYF
jgi:hypothetical protein